jgi:membrane protein DedA with SNARE-associated domain
MHEIINSIVTFSLVFINKIGYLGIFLGMFLESTIFPLPSEVIMIPAGIAAANGDMNLWIVLFCGIFGNVAGAIFSYYIAFYLGRPILLKIGHFFFIKPQTILKIENYFNSHGEISVFVGRLLVGFRHFISIPAGIAKMNIIRFTSYTFFGSAIWTSILTFLGFFIAKNQELIEQYLSSIAVGVVLFCALIIAIYIFFKPTRK